MKLDQLFLVCIFGFLSLSAQARIGETEAQCNARYGPPMAKVTKGDKQYSKNGYIIFVWFKDGKAAQIQYTRSFNGSSDTLKSEEVDAFLAANAEGLSWSRPTKLYLQEARREDGNAYAQAERYALTITSKEWRLERNGILKQQAENAKAKVEAEKKKKFEGF